VVILATSRPPASTTTRPGANVIQPNRPQPVRNPPVRTSDQIREAAEAADAQVEEEGDEEETEPEPAGPAARPGLLPQTGAPSQGSARPGVVVTPPQPVRPGVVPPPRRPPGG
jgi:hypothetical protein